MNKRMKSICIVLCLMLGASALDRYPTTREVDIFVNVYDHPKTGFSCHDKNPGEYYADPATKCAVYYVCIQNPTGTLSPQSFACPNGTIFSQATRVCRPHEQATRYYDSVQGGIDTKYDVELPQAPQVAAQQPATKPVPVARTQPLPFEPAKPQTAPQIARSRPPQSQRARAPPPAQPASNSSPSSANRFSNSRSFQSINNFAGTTSTTTTTTTTTTTSAPIVSRPASNPSGLADYEYDYGDYNETGHGQSASSLLPSSGVALLNSASSLHAQILDNVRHNIEQDKRLEAAAATAGEKVAKLEPLASSSIIEPLQLESSKKTQRVKRAASKQSSIMLHRRKGQLKMASNIESSVTNTIELTCSDKIAGAAYADVGSSCQAYYVCLEVGKGKLAAYRLACAGSKRFNQARGHCDKHTSDKMCASSERYFHYNKWYRPSKKHWGESNNKDIE